MSVGVTTDQKQTKKQSQFLDRKLLQEG